MGVPVARVGDLGVGQCCCHPPVPCIGMSGTVSTGSVNVFAAGSLVTRIGDIVIGGCGHVGIIVSGSGSVIVNGIPASRIGDAFVGCFTGTIVTGAPNVLVG